MNVLKLTDEEMTLTREDAELLIQVIKEDSSYEHWKYQRNYFMSCAITKTYWMPHYLESLEHADKKYQHLHKTLKKLKTLIDNKPFKEKV